MVFLVLYFRTLLIFSSILSLLHVVHVVLVGCLVSSFFINYATGQFLNTVIGFLSGLSSDCSFTCHFLFLFVHNMSHPTVYFPLILCEIKWLATLGARDLNGFFFEYVFGYQLLHIFWVTFC